MTLFRASAVAAIMFMSVQNSVFAKTSPAVTCDDRFPHTCQGLTFALQKTVKQKKYRKQKIHYSGSMTTISACGKSVRVSPKAASAFRGFLTELCSGGYKIDFVGGYRNTYIAGTKIKSLHASGLAIDVNQTARNRVTRRLPAGVTQMAARYGLKHGAVWRSPDAGHFELASASYASNDDWTEKFQSAKNKMLGRQKGTRVASLDPSIGTERRGTVLYEIERAARIHGVSLQMMKAFAKIESSFNPRARTGSYKGLFQLSELEFNKYGSGNIYDARDNAMASANKFATEFSSFREMTGKEPSHFEMYMIHQQGWEGAAMHAAYPDRPAWKNMYATREGAQKGPRWARKAIWGNIPSNLKRKFRGGVMGLTSAQFMSIWRTRVNHIAFNTGG